MSSILYTSMSYMSHFLNKECTINWMNLQHHPRQLSFSLPQLHLCFHSCQKWWHKSHLPVFHQSLLHTTFNKEENEKEFKKPYKNTEIYWWGFFVCNKIWEKRGKCVTFLIHISYFINLFKEFPIANNTGYTFCVFHILWCESDLK